MPEGYFINLSLTPSRLMWAQKFPYDFQTFLPLQLVQLEFLNIDLVDCSGLCSCDTIEVYDPASHDIEHLVRSICEDSEDGPIITSGGHTLKVVFTGDEFGTNAAFQARWMAMGDNTNTECGDTITSDTGNLSYPRFSDNYDDLVNCVWTIRTSGEVGQ